MSETFISDMKDRLLPENYRKLCDPAFVYITLALLFACILCVVGTLTNFSMQSLAANSSGLLFQILSIFLCTFIISMICQLGDTGVIVAWILVIPTIICVLCWLSSLISAGLGMATFMNPAGNPPPASTRA